MDSDIIKDDLDPQTPSSSNTSLVLASDNDINVESDMEVSETVPQQETPENKIIVDSPTSVTPLSTSVNSDNTSSGGSKKKVTLVTPNKNDFKPAASENSFDFINRQLSILNEASGELTTTIHKSNDQKKRDLAKKKRYGRRRELYKSPAKGLAKSRGIKRYGYI